MASLVRRKLPVFVALAALCAATQPAPGVEVHDQAPPFSVEDLDGQVHALSEMSGTVILLFFFNPENPFSVSHAPKLESDIWSEFNWHNFMILGINVGPQERDAVVEFRDATKVTFPLVTDGIAVGTDYGAGANQFIVVDGHGIVRYVSTGTGAQAYDESALRAAVSGALEDVSPPRESTWGRIKKLFEGELLQYPR